MGALIERDIEKYLCRRVLKLGGLCEKHTASGRRSVPDRLVTLPQLPMFLVECKAPGKKPTAGQLRDHERRRSMGQQVHVVDTKEKVDAMLDAKTNKELDPELWRSLI